MARSHRPRFISHTAEGKRNDRHEQRGGRDCNLRPQVTGGRMMPNYAAQAAIKCKEPLFTQFLYQCEHYAGRTPESADQALRNLAKIESRSELNHPDNFTKWFEVLRLFGKWRQGFGNDADGDPAPPFLMGQRAWERDCQLDDNPYHRDDGPDIDRPHDLWAQGWKTRKWRDDHDKKGRS